MIPKKLKIKGKLRVEYIFKKGRRISTRFFQLRALPSRGPETRFALIIPKKASKNAVERNNIRRRTYSALRRTLPHLPQTCYDVVILVHPAIASAPFDEMEKAFSWAIKRM